MPTDHRDFFDVLLANQALLGPLLLVARVLMATVFIVFGTFKVRFTSQMQGYMAARRVPGFLIYPVILLQIGGGILLVLGYHTRPVALLLAGFCIIAPSLFHSNFSDTGELAHFTKDIAIAGGLIFLIAFGPGPISLDAYLNARTF